jgi:uncharacterized integral membrane protein
MLDTKRGQATTGWLLIFVLIIIVPLGILFIVMNHVLNIYVTPIANTMVQASPYTNVSQQTIQIAQMTQYDQVWFSLPIVIIIILILWLIMNATKHRPMEY